LLQQDDGIKPPSTSTFDVTTLPIPRRGRKKELEPEELSILGAMLAGFAFVWRGEKIAVGFCGIGREPSTQLGDMKIPEFTQVLIP
jgi:hypothetical protein